MNGEENNWNSPSGGSIPAFGGYFPMNGEEPPPHEWGGEENNNSPTKERAGAPQNPGA